MEPIEADVEEVLEDVAGVVSGLETGEVRPTSSEVRKTEEITYLLPDSWQSITDGLLALHQSLAPVDGSPAPGEIPAVGGTAGMLKRLARKSVYWYVNPVVEQLHRTHAATERALSEIAEQLKNSADRLEVIEKENLDRKISVIEERIDRLEEAAEKNREADD